MKRRASGSESRPVAKSKTYTPIYLDLLEPNIRYRINEMVEAYPDTKILRGYREKLHGFKDWEDMLAHRNTDCVSYSMYILPFFFDALRDITKEWVFVRDHAELPLYSKQVVLEGNTLLRCLILFFRLDDGDILRDPNAPVLWKYDESNGMFCSRPDPRKLCVNNEDVLVRKGSSQWNEFASQYE